MVFDMTERVEDAWRYYDALLDDHIKQIAEKAGVEPEKLKKINPAEFVEQNKMQTIRGYQFKQIGKWIAENKTDDCFLISPEDAVEETAAQISYKSGTEIWRKIRASKCEVVPCPKELALDFFIRNHRQTLPNFRETAVCFGLTHKDELVAVMFYDISNGAVRGNNKKYELVRLSISKGTQIHGGASKLQKACEDTLRMMGVKEIYSYSNATINNGAVYKQLGFECKKIEGGQPFVIRKDNSIIRLISLHPNSTDEALALRGQLKTHLGGNKTWVKNIGEGDGQTHTTGTGERNS